MLSDLKRRILERVQGDGLLETPVPGFEIYTTAKPNIEVPTVYNPSICLVLQGRKQALLEGETYVYAVSDFLAISVDLPLIGKVLEASPAKRFLSLKINIDPALMSELVAQIGPRNFSNAATQRGLFIGKLDDALADCVARLTNLMDQPRDIPFLGPIIKREIHYRLLMGEHGPMIAQMTGQGTRQERIAQVIRKMKADISKPIRIETLAEMANMSPSSFHTHFKKMTLMSPLQYYKRLRLTTARHIMLAEGADATSTAYRVGYESPSQFSREYARMFGAPPIRDIEGMRLLSPA